MAELQECITDDSWKQSLQSEIITALTDQGKRRTMPWNRLGTIINVALQHFYTNTIGINHSI